MADDSMADEAKEGMTDAEKRLETHTRHLLAGFRSGLCHSKIDASGFAIALSDVVREAARDELKAAGRTEGADGGNSGQGASFFDAGFEAGFYKAEISHHVATTKGVPAHCVDVVRDHERADEPAIPDRQLVMVRDDLLEFWRGVHEGAAKRIGADNG